MHILHTLAVLFMPVPLSIRHTLAATMALLGQQQQTQQQQTQQLHLH
jgi:hypothetical protein